MAKNLCSKDLKTGTGASRYPLIGDGSNLLIISKKTNWTSKSFVVTPIDELYFMAATYGHSSSWQATASGVFADGVTMSNRLASLMNGATVAEWQQGHKPMIHYCARSCCPWMFKTQKNIYNPSSILEYMEYGGCWNARKFNLYALPVGKASSFSAKLRVWNGSLINTGPAVQYAYPVYLAGHSTCEYFDYQYNNAGNLRYNFSKDLMPPSQYAATGYGEIDIAAHANNNKREPKWYIEYDIYNTHLSCECSTNYYNGNYQNTRIFANSSSDKSAYFYDYDITGDGLTSLKNAIQYGSFWMYTGYKMADICSAAGRTACMDPFHTMLNYVSRIELVLTITMSAFNNT